jgi:hypothetical protein
MEKFSKKITSLQQNPGSRSWFYTWNNSTPEELELIKKLDATYHVIGFETAPTTGTKHLQGCVTLKTARRFFSLKDEFPKVHWEVVISVDHARKYCKKEGDFWESGPQPFKGKRSDLDRAIEVLKETSDLTSVALEHPSTYVRYHNGLSALLRDSMPPQTIRPKVYWIYGPSGTGKTKYVVDREPELFISSDGLKWFDGYNNQPTVLFDDFRSSHIDFAFMLRLLDGYPVRVQVKGSSRQFNAKSIYITTPKHPQDTFDWELLGEDSTQLLRRIYKIISFSTHETKNASTLLISRRLDTRGVFGRPRRIVMEWVNEHDIPEDDSDIENYLEDDIETGTLPRDDIQFFLN